MLGVHRVELSLPYPVFISSGYSRSGMLDHMVVLVFVFFRNFYISPRSGCTSPHSHQQWARAPVAHTLAGRVTARLRVAAVLQG